MDSERRLGPVEPFKPLSPVPRRRMIVRVVVAPFLWLAALLIGLIGDLPDASSNRIELVLGHYVEANSKPSAGFYMETLGAVILLITCVWGFLLAGPPRPARSGS